MAAARTGVDHNLRLGKAENRMHDRTPSAPHLTDSERLDRLRLIRSDNVGPRGIMAQTPQAGPPNTVHIGVDDARPKDVVDLHPKPELGTTR